ncbi:hypothetical protein X975_19421, partial [Stegodyphus mimosarum]
MKSTKILHHADELQQNELNFRRQGKFLVTLNTNEKINGFEKKLSLQCQLCKTDIFYHFRS